MAARKKPSDTSVLPPELHDFRNFVFLLWQHLHLPEPTPNQYEIAETLQHGPKRQVVEGFRGIAKTWITAAYVIWFLGMNPQKKTLILSASKNHADKISTFIQDVIQSWPVVHALRPRPDQRTSKVMFDIGPAQPDPAPSVSSLGITGQVTGSRADLIVCDDLETPQNSLTHLMRERLWESVKECDSIIKPGGKIILLGTPHNLDSLYDEMAKRGYTVTVWPARYPDPRRREFYGSRLSPLIAGQLDTNPELVGTTTEPTRFSETDLIERETSLGKSGFSLQYMLDTSLSDADKNPLKLADLMVMGLNPDLAPSRVVWANSRETRIEDLQSVGMHGDRYYAPMQVDTPFVEYQGCVMAIDPSGRGKDELGYAVVKHHAGTLYVAAASGMSGGFTDANLEKLAQVAALHKVQYIVVEENFGGGMFTQLLKPWLMKLWPCTVEDIRHSVQKERRICDTLEPVMNQHRLVFDRKVIEADLRSIEGYASEVAYQYMLMWQLTHISRERGCLAHDDRLDALAMAVAYWADKISLDRKAAADLIREDLIRQEIEDHQEHTIGLKTRQLRWSDIPENFN